MRPRKTRSSLARPRAASRRSAYPTPWELSKGLIMAVKANFTADEWSRVLASPMVAGTAITAADPSGLWGLLKEGMAGGWALLHAKQDPNANALVKAVADDFASGDARSPARERIQTTFKGAQAGDLKRRAVDELRQV